MIELSLHVPSFIAGMIATPVLLMAAYFIWGPK